MFLLDSSAIHVSLNAVSRSVNVSGSKLSWYWLKVLITSPPRGEHAAQTSTIYTTPELAGLPILRSLALPANYGFTVVSAVHRGEVRSYPAGQQLAPKRVAKLWFRNYNHNSKRVQRCSGETS